MTLRIIIIIINITIITTTVMILIIITLSMKNINRCKKTASTWQQQKMENNKYNKTNSGQTLGRAWELNKNRFVRPNAKKKRAITQQTWKQFLKQFRTLWILAAVTGGNWGRRAHKSWNLGILRCGQILLATRNLPGQGRRSGSQNFLFPYSEYS